jgi:DNA-binding response OmpR family regulator
MTRIPHPAQSANPRPVVLVVEDEPQLQRVLQRLLEAEGYAVELAADGATGLACIEAGHIDLVLLDVVLPDIDGFELCRRVRAQEGEVHLPIIMLTGLASEAQRHAGFVAGADDYVAKPFKRADLLDRMQVWLWIRQRLKGAQARQRGDRGRLRGLEEQAVRARLAQDEAVLVMARTASDQLLQPLTALLGWLDLWRDMNFSGESPEYWYGKFQTAAESLAARVDALTRVMRYETKEVAGQIQLDVARAQSAPPQRRRRLAHGGRRAK